MLRCFLAFLILMSVTTSCYGSSKKDEIINSTKGRFYSQQLDQLNKRKIVKTREFDNLIEQLDNNETIQAIRRSYMLNSGRGLFVLTQKRVVFIDEYGFTSTTINIKLDDITNIIDGKNLFYAFIDLTSGGHRYYFYDLGKKEAPKIAEYIRQHTKNNIPIKQHRNDDIVGKLERLIELKQSGALTDEEFQTAKLKLLN